jgi:hypothetical protein
MNRQTQIENFLLAAHRLALSRLRETPSRVEEAKGLLSRWRALDGPTRSDPYWDEWDQLLNVAPEMLERVVCASGDHPAALRSVSPLGVLLTQQERTSLLAQARQP